MAGGVDHAASSPVHSGCPEWGHAHHRALPGLRHQPEDRLQVAGPGMRPAAVPALADRSRRPQTSPTATAPELVQAVLEARHRHPTWGPRKLLRLLLAAATGRPVARAQHDRPPSAPRRAGRHTAPGPPAGASRPPPSAHGRAQCHLDRGLQRPVQARPWAVLLSTDRGGWVIAGCCCAARRSPAPRWSRACPVFLRAFEEYGLSDAHPLRQRGALRHAGARAPLPALGVVAPPRDSARSHRAGLATAERSA